MTSAPLRIALVDDYEIVLAGLREMLGPYGDHFDVVEVDTDVAMDHPVDIALYDTYGQDDRALSLVSQRLQDSPVDHVVLYTWNLEPELVEGAQRLGVAGVLSKTMGAAELVSSLQLIAAGQRIYSPTTTVTGAASPVARGGDWPGRSEGLTMREAEMVALISQGLSNAEIAQRTYLSPNSVKSYIRSAYRKIGVQRRSQAVAWGIDHRMVPDRAHQLD